MHSFSFHIPNPFPKAFNDKAKSFIKGLKPNWGQQTALPELAADIKPVTH